MYNILYIFVYVNNKIFYLPSLAVCLSEQEIRSWSKGRGCARDPVHAVQFSIQPSAEQFSIPPIAEQFSI